MMYFNVCIICFEANASFKNECVSVVVIVEKCLGAEIALCLILEVEMG